MKIVFTPFPTLLFYTDNLPQDVGGRTNACVVRIRQKYRDNGDVGIHQHEYTHVQQFYAWLIACTLIATMVSLFFSGFPAWLIVSYGFALGLIPDALLYRLVDRYRLWAEVHAYRVQASHYPPGTDVTWMATVISTKYGLTITPEAAAHALWG